MKTRMFFAALGTIALLTTGVAYAQTPAATDKPAATAKPAAKTAAKPRSAKSIECSKQADAKGLHGKERKKFRSECKKGA
jgi:hypothetical protein